MPRAYWLLKSEPETYNFGQLLADGETNWDHVRNYQARNYLRKAKVGDQALIYHSGADKAVVGIAQVIKVAYRDPDPDGGDWVQIDLKPVKKLERPVTLAEIKSVKTLVTLPLIRQSRLSCMPITEAHFKALVKMGAQ